MRVRPVAPRLLFFLVFLLFVVPAAWQKVAPLAFEAHARLATQTAAHQASAVQQLLAEAKSTRTAVLAATTSVGGCKNLSGSAQAFERAAVARQSQTLTARGLDVSFLPHPVRLQTALVTALDRSYAADNALAAWAHDVQNRRCSGASLRSQLRQQADALSATATAAKASFIALWRPIATRYHHPMPAEVDI